MAVILNQNNLTAPGIYVSESTVGILPVGLASFSYTYMLITGASGPYNKPTQVISSDDFTNQFGISNSLDSVKLFFRNYPAGILFVVRVGAPNRYDVQIGSTIGTGAYTLTVNGTAITYTASSTDTQASVVAGLTTVINNTTETPNAIATAGTNGLLRIEAQNIGDTLTVLSTAVPGSGTMTVGTYQHTITLGTATAGVWSLIINGTTVSYTAGASPTLSSIVSGLAAAISANTTVNAIASVTSITGTSFVLQPTTSTLLTVGSLTAPGSGTITDALSSIPLLYGQFIYANERSFDPDLNSQGFLIAPEAFQTFTIQQNRTALTVSMENLCNSEGYDWMALVDSGNPTIISNSDQAKTEGLLYTTARGHLAYFHPYIYSIDNATVPVSAMVAAIGLRRFSEQGFNQPPAGGQYPAQGVLDVVTRYSKSQQAVLNPLGINLVRYLPNQGVLVYGSRTRSSSPYYRFITTRIILNVAIGTLRTAFNTLIFSGVDGQGVLFTRLRETAEAILYQMWDGGALYGATPADAFAVICNGNNNPALDLEQGVVRLDCYLAPAPIMERLLISVNRTAIGQVKTVVSGLSGN